jgi:hypothetical protein
MGLTWQLILVQVSTTYNINFKLILELISSVQFFKHKYPEVAMPPTTKFKQMNIQA